MQKKDPLSPEYPPERVERGLVSRQSDMWPIGVAIMNILSTHFGIIFLFTNHRVLYSYVLHERTTTFMYR